ncbi:MAG: hypothetical protein JXN64_06380 [Spirochaetes bacterium]|nr:hypothetical protein [Spirochaetota bacterium]
MALNQRIDYVAALDDWLNEPYKFGHLLGYTKLTFTHNEWIKIFLKYGIFDLLMAHRNSYKTTCGIIAMVLLFMCNPDMRLLIVRKNMLLSSAVLKSIQKHILTNDIVRLYLYSRWNILDVKTKDWSSERTTLAFKKSVTPEPSITAAGVGSSIVGSHFDYIWMDDIETIEDRYSNAERNWTLAYFNETENLIEPLGCRRLSGTPWHEEGVFSKIPEKHFQGRKFPIGTVDLPEKELQEIYARKDRLPYAEWCCNYELRHVQDNDTIGAFNIADNWDCQYCVGFIDPSFSDKTDTDKTAVAVVGVNRHGKLLFTGITLPKSISDRATRIEILTFIQRFTPIETVIESQLAETSIFFIDAFRADEAQYQIKNHWTIKRQFRNKHERIAATVIANKPDMLILNGTQQEFSLGVSRYYKGAPHDDEPDSLAGAIEHLASSPIVAEYAEAIHILSQRK